MSAEFGWSRTELSSVFSIATIVNVVMFPSAGYLVDRFGPRRIIPIEIALLAASYGALSLVNSYIAFVALACVIAATGSLASYPSYLALPPKWFDRNLGLAIALASSGIGVGSWCFPYIINTSLQSVGWRQTFVVVGAIAFVIGVVNFIAFIRDTGDRCRKPSAVRARTSRPRMTSTTTHLRRH